MTSLVVLPPIAAGDHAGEVISAWPDGAISATAVHRVRIAGLDGAARYGRITVIVRQLAWWALAH
ncbi:MAG TPA: hypothetical protein VN345_20565 [Blastocatellia bacterium]|nr:hypothetical protein [Blastocatellia bacterium]